MRKFILILAVIIFIACEKNDQESTSKAKGNPPIAYAGADMSVTIPDEICELVGTDRSMDPSAYRAFIWTTLQSPPILEISQSENASRAYPFIMQAGNYMFKLLVRNFYGENTDTVSVNVKWAPRCNSEREVLSGGRFVPTGTVLENIPYNTSMAVGNGKLVFAGGTKENYDPWDYGQTPINFLSIFEPASGKYFSHSLTVPRFNVNISMMGELVFIGGGYEEKGISNLVEIFDQATEKIRVHKLTVGRDAMTSAVLGHLILFAGGITGDGKVSDVVEIYNLDTDSWSVAKLSSARTNISVVVANDKVFFGGGYTSTGGASDVIDVYEPSTGSWTTLKLSEGRVSMQGFIYDGKVVFAGGYKYNQTPSTSIDFIDPVTLKSTQDCLVKGSLNSFYQSSEMTTSALALGDRLYVNDGGHLAYLDKSSHKWIYSTGPGINYSMFTSGNKIYAFDHLSSHQNKYVIYKYEE
jgi:hypothetical protein